MKKYIPKEYCTDVQTEFVEWILCPVCRNKTRFKIRKDTVLENFPLYCPKCKQETHISNMITHIIVLTVIEHIICCLVSIDK